MQAALIRVCHYATALKPSRIAQAWGYRQVEELLKELNETRTAGHPVPDFVQYMDTPEAFKAALM